MAQWLRRQRKVIKNLLYSRRLLMMLTAQWLRKRTSTEQTWVQLPLAPPIWVTGGGRKASGQNCSHVPIKVLTLVGMSKHLNTGVNYLKFRRYNVKDKMTHWLSVCMCLYLCACAMWCACVCTCTCVCLCVHVCLVVSTSQQQSMPSRHRLMTSHVTQTSSMMTSYSTCLLTCLCETEHAASEVSLIYQPLTPPLLILVTILHTLYLNKRTILGKLWFWQV